jgi:hypothetical protein
MANPQQKPGAVPGTRLQRTIKSNGGVFLPLSALVLGASQCAFPDRMLFPGVPGGSYIFPICLINISILSLAIVRRTASIDRDLGQSRNPVLKALHLLNIGVQVYACYLISQTPQRTVPWDLPPAARRDYAPYEDRDADEPYSDRDAYSTAGDDTRSRVDSGDSADEQTGRGNLTDRATAEAPRQ